MLPSYNIFKEEIEQIENYLESVKCYNAILQLDVQKVDVSNEFKNEIANLQNISRKINKRKYDYTVIIVSLYGCFERYIEDFVKDYLMIVIGASKKYKELPETIRKKHIDLSVELMGKIDQPKYNNILTKEQIIKNLNDCIENNRCMINYEAFCQHTANYRISIIGEVLKNIGLVDMVNGVKRNDILKEMYIKQNGECTYDSLKLDIIFSFVNELADRRNQIAHGSISDILSFDLQMQMVEKMKVFVQEMDAIGFEKALPYLVNMSYKIEKIYNENKKTKLLCFELKKGTISKDAIIIKKLNNVYSYCKIESVEINKKRYNIYEAKDSTNVGVMLEKTRKLNEEYWIYLC